MQNIDLKEASANDLKILVQGMAEHTHLKMFKIEIYIKHPFCMTQLIMLNNISKLCITRGQLLQNKAYRIINIILKSAKYFMVLKTEDIAKY